MATMADPRIFVTRQLSIDPRTVVGPGVEVLVHAGSDAPPRTLLLDLARGAHALVTMPTDPVDAALLDALPDLRVVANHAVGLDNIDLQAARERQVWVTHTPDVLTDATAELTFALLLALARRLREGERLVREGRFSGWTPTLLLGRGLRGKTLGVLGHGRIGQAVARLASAFGMEVLYTSSRSLRWGHEGPGPEVGLGALLERSDVVTIHCALTPTTRGLLGEEALARMKRGALLVNTARGAVVDEGALVRALERGHLGGAALDVYEREPEVHPGLRGRDDVVLLPHLGSATEEARHRMAELALGDAARVLRGEAPLHPAVVGRGEVRA
jgi:glyoxylate reductase